MSPRYLRAARRHGHGASACALAAAFVLSACSVLQVDVDVYKGPLAHEEEVQARQFAALAVAAKPMLAGLRNDVEDARRKRIGVPLLGKDPALQPGDLEAHMRDVKLHTRLSAFINGVLLSYEDLADPPLVAARVAAEAAAAAAGDLEPTADDLALGRRIPDTPALGAIAKDFADKYRQFICGASDGQAAACTATTRRSGTPMVYSVGDEAQQGRVEHCTKLAAAGASGEAPLARGLVCTKQPRSNEGFALLRDERQVRIHSLILFGKEDKDFIARVTQLGRRFHEARAATRSLMRNAAAALRERQPLSPEARQLSEVVVESVQVRLLACLVTPRQPSAMQGPMEMQLGAALAPMARADTDKADRAGEMRREIQRIAAAAPREFADWLRSADIDSELAPPPGFPDCALNQRRSRQLSSVVARQYGLGRGPEPDSAKTARANLEDIDAKLRSLAAGNAHGFDRARLPDGIETLTRRFLETAQRNASDPNAADLLRAREALGESLIAFAERVLFVADRLTPSAIDEEVGDVGAATASNARGPASGEYVAADLSSADSNLRARIGVRMGVLQSLGNSLVLHANDMRRRQNQRLAQVGMGNVEAAAVLQATAPGADAAFGNLTTHAAAKQRNASAAATAASAVHGKAAAARLAASTAASGAQGELGKAERQASDARTLRQQLVALWRSVAEVPAQLAYGEVPIDDVALGQEAIDRAALLESFDKRAPPPAPAGLRDWLDSWFASRQAEPAGNAVPRAGRLALARQALAAWGDALALATPDAAKPASLLEAARKQIEQRAKRADTEARALAQQRDERQRALDRAKLSFEQAEAEIVAQKQTHDAATSEADSGSAFSKALDQVRAEVVDEAAKAKPPVRDHVGTLRLAAEKLLARAKAPATAAADRKSLDAAREWLQTLTPLPAPASLAPGRALADDPKRVYDELMAHMRQQRIAATAAGETERANRLAQAIELAYEARSATLFLRPASDFLKSVYSSTAVQDEIDGPDANMLDDWLRVFRRSLSLGGDSLSRGQREARQQVEKLHWQGINSVQVRGGGDVNYTLIKDDVGNWVVKAYAADTGSIIRSVQSLALFARGARIDNDLLRRLNLEREASDPSLTQEQRKGAGDQLNKMGPAAHTGLDKVRSALAEEHFRTLATAAVKLGTDLAEAGTPLVEELVKAGADAKLKDPLAAHVAEAYKTAKVSDSIARLKAAANFQASDAGRRDKLDEALVAHFDTLANLGTALVTRVNGDKELGGDGARQSIAMAVRKWAEARLDSLSKTIQVSLERLDSGLLVIGRAASTP